MIIRPCTELYVDHTQLKSFFDRYETKNCEKYDRRNHKQNKILIIKILTDDS